jgi:hypothetical protein
MHTHVRPPSMHIQLPLTKQEGYYLPPLPFLKWEGVVLLTSFFGSGKA